MYPSLKQMKEKISGWYLIYELTTSVHVLDSWEKCLFSKYTSISNSN